MPKKIDKKKELKFLSDISLSTSFIDNLIITSRADGMFLVRLLTSLPEGLKEDFRMAVTKSTLKQMLDVLCKQSNYYPVPKKEGKAKTGPTKSDKGINLN